MLHGEHQDLPFCHLPFRCACCLEAEWGEATGISSFHFKADIFAARHYLSLGFGAYSTRFRAVNHSSKGSELDYHPTDGLLFLPKKLLLH